MKKKFFGSKSLKFFSPVIFFKFLVIKNLDIDPDPDSSKSLDADHCPDSVNPETEQGLVQ
jgi:hypothetical protein